MATSAGTDEECLICFKPLIEDRVRLDQVNCSHDQFHVQCVSSTEIPNCPVCGTLTKIRSEQPGPVAPEIPSGPRGPTGCPCLWYMADLQRYGAEYPKELNCKLFNHPKQWLQGKIRERQQLIDIGAITDFDPYTDSIARRLLPERRRLLWDINFRV